MAITLHRAEFTMVPEPAGVKQVLWVLWWEPGRQKATVMQPHLQDRRGSPLAASSISNGQGSVSRRRQWGSHDAVRRVANGVG